MPTGLESIIDLAMSPLRNDEIIKGQIEAIYPEEVPENAQLDYIAFFDWREDPQYTTGRTPARNHYLVICSARIEVYCRAREGKPDAGLAKAESIARRISDVYLGNEDLGLTPPAEWLTAPWRMRARRIDYRLPRSPYKWRKGQTVYLAKLLYHYWTNRMW